MHCVRIPLIAILAVATCALGPAAAKAGHPLTTEDTETVEPGKVELERATATYTRDDGEHGTTSARVTVGLSSDLHVSVAYDFLRITSPDGGDTEIGPGDVILGAKYRLLDETPAVPAAMVYLTLRLPTGDANRGLGDEGFDVGLLAGASKTFGPVTLMANAGYTFNSIERSLDVWTLSGAVAYAVSRSWTLVAEAVSVLPSTEEPATLVILGGAALAISERMSISMGAGVGATRTSPEFVITAGVTFRF